MESGLSSRQSPRGHPALRAKGGIAQFRPYDKGTSLPTALPLTGRDRHLDVVILVTVEGSAIAMTASVVPHSALGRALLRRMTRGPAQG